MLPEDYEVLKSTCPQCGKRIPYGSECQCKAEHNRNRHKYYDRTQRNQEAVAIYHSTAWAIARQTAIARDNGLCLLCLTDKRITPCDMVHHIVEISEDQGRAYDKDNLISLCNGCHAKVHAEHEHNKTPMQNTLRKLIKSEG